MRRLPLSLSRLGFGVTGPHASPLVAPQVTASLIASAIAEGVTLFDTGPMYGGGEGERRLGAALRVAARDRVFVCTKARTWPLKAGSDAIAGTPADRVRRSLDASLTRLGLDRVDALFLHGPRCEDFAPPLMATLAALKAEGLIGAIGVCGRGPELDAALDAEGIDFLMMPLEGQAARLGRAASRGVAVLAIETMRSARTGLRAPASAADLWYLARAGRDALAGAPPASGPGIAAALQQPAVCSVIVQTTRLEHLRANAATARMAL